MYKEVSVLFEFNEDLKIFNYDAKLLSGFKCANTVDILGIVFDIIFFFYIYSNQYEFRYDYDLWRIILFGSILYIIYEIAKIYSKYLISQNIKRERLEITDNGINITYNEKILFRDSLKYIEIPWEKIRYAQTLEHNATLQNTSFIKLLSYREEYKTIQIFTADGLFKIFIENSFEAANLINSKTKTI